MSKRKRYLSVINFGDGFKVPVVDRRLRKVPGQYIPDQPDGGGRIIEMDDDPKTPEWTRMETYSHEILHAAIDFDLYMRTKARELEVSGYLRTIKALQGGLNEGQSIPTEDQSSQPASSGEGEGQGDDSDSTVRNAEDDSNIQWSKGVKSGG